MYVLPAGHFFWSLRPALFPNTKPLRQAWHQQQLLMTTLITVTIRIHSRGTFPHWTHRAKRELRACVRVYVCVVCSWFVWRCLWVSEKCVYVRAQHNGANGVLDFFFFLKRTASVTYNASGKIEFVFLATWILSFKFILLDTHSPHWQTIKSIRRHRARDQKSAEGLNFFSILN